MPLSKLDDDPSLFHLYHDLPPVSSNDGVILAHPKVLSASDDNNGGDFSVRRRPLEWICGVNHEYLKQLFQVSKSINEAAKIAKEYHFAYGTPSKVPVFRGVISPGE